MVFGIVVAKLKYLDPETWRPVGLRQFEWAVIHVMINRGHKL